MTRNKAVVTAGLLKAMGYKLYGKRIAVLRDAAEEYTGAIIIPDDAKESTKRRRISGTVVMMGQGVLTEQREKGDDSQYAGLELGDWVTFSKYDGTVHKVKLPDGTEIEVEVMAAFDIYIGFAATERDTEVRA